MTVNLSKAELTSLLAALGVAEDCHNAVEPNQKVLDKHYEKWEQLSEKLAEAQADAS